MKPHTLVLLAALALAPVAAHAEADIVSPDTVHGLVDLRLSLAGGERGFTDGGYGKLRYGGDGDTQARVRLAEAAIEWTPRLNWEWSAVVDIVAQPGQEKPFDLMQAYVAYKPVPRSSTRFSARAGLFYAPVSLEHDGPVWGLTNTITPSAINSWIGEEGKVLGFEARAQHDFGEQSVAVTGGVFGYDDTAGTLLTYRGWALHDLKSTAQGEFPLPPLTAFGASVQDQETYSTLEIDHRAGYYGHAEWRPSGAVALDATYFSNAGNKIGVVHGMQWAWDTHFTNVGADIKAGPHTRILAQAMAGRTVMGFPTPDGVFADVVFRSAYALVSQAVGGSTFTGRVDLFDVRDHSVILDDNNDETGWSLTGAWRHALSAHADVRLEAVHVSSRRPSRATAGLPARQSQTLVQSSLRLSF